MADNFKLDVDADGIALITWDMPGRSMNVIDLAVIEELSAHRREGRGRRRDQGRGHHLRQGDVLRRRRPDHAGGADARRSPTWPRSKGEEAAVTRAVRRKAASCRSSTGGIETCGKPWVAAINGTALGGGFELCARLPSPRRRRQSDKTRLGLPEVKIGLFPGAGGTQRVARMMPPADALQFLLKGDQLRLNRAKAMKLVDAVVPAADLDQDREGLDQGRRQGRRRRGTSTASGCRAGRSIPRPG